MYRDGKVKFFIFETYSTKVFCHEVISEINLVIPDAVIYVYVASTSRIGKHSKTALQYDHNCGWFALEACFRISKTTNIFQHLEANLGWYKSLQHILLSHKYIKILCSQQKCGWRNVVFLFPEFLKPELSRLFISTQSRDLYYQLPVKAHNFPVSAKRGLTLDQNISRRHEAGLKLFNDTYAPSQTSIDISPAWPNKLPRDHEAYQNHSIWYFRLKYLKEIIDWITQIPGEQIEQLRKKRLDFSKLLQPQLI